MAKKSLSYFYYQRPPLSSHYPSWTDGPGYAGAWNFGPSDDEVWTVKEIVKETIGLWGQGSSRVDDHGNPHEAQWLKLDCSKARIDLKWKPRYTVEQALGKTVEWYKQFYEGAGTEEIRIFTQRQIEEYMALGA